MMSWSLSILPTLNKDCIQTKLLSPIRHMCTTKLYNLSPCTTMWRACPVAIMPLPSLAIIFHIYSTSVSPPICNPATLGLESHNPKHVFLILIQHSTYSCSLARASTHATQALPYNLYMNKFTQSCHGSLYYIYCPQHTHDLGACRL